MEEEIYKLYRVRIGSDAVAECEAELSALRAAVVDRDNPEWEKASERLQGAASALMALGIYPMLEDDDSVYLAFPGHRGLFDGDGEANGGDD